jgi:membrane-associated phospholipid phosphatase
MHTQADGHPAAASRAVEDGRRERRLLLIAGGAYVGATAVLVAVFGELLVSRDVVFIWLMGLLFVLSLNNRRRYFRGLLIDWLPFIAFLFAYDFARSLADTTGIAPHYNEMIRIDRVLFGSPIPTVWLQDHLYHPPAAAWYDYAAWITYITHFFGTLTLAVVLWRYAYPLFKRWRTLVIWVSTAGFTTYVLFPAAPPWLASLHGKIGFVHKIKDEMFAHTGTKSITSAVENKWVDQVAAVPSLHAAFPFLMMLLFWHRGWRWRIPFGLYALAMGFTLVYTGEHYAADVLLGYGYALVTFLLVSLYWRRKERRAADRAAEERVGAAPAPAPGEPAPQPVTYSVGPASPRD